MSAPDIPIPSVEGDETFGFFDFDFDFNFGFGSESDFLSQYSDMDRDPFLLELAVDTYGLNVTGEQVDALNEQLRRRAAELGHLELAVDEFKRNVLVNTCRTSIDKRLQLATQIRNEIEAYERAAEKIRNLVVTKYAQAHKTKDTDVRGWKNARAEMHDALIPASKSLQALERLCDRYEKWQTTVLESAYELMCEPYNLEYGTVEGFYAPEPDPVAPLMDLKIRGYDDRTRRRLAKGFRYVKSYRSFMENPRQKEMREYAKHKVYDEDEPQAEGTSRPKTEDADKVENGQGTPVRDNPTASPGRRASPRSQAPSPPSHRNTPTAADLDGANLDGPIPGEGTSTDPRATDAE